MSLIITRNFKRAKAQDAAAKDKAPDGWWEGKTIFAAFGWGKSVKGKVVSHKGGVIKLEDGTQFKESDAYDLYAIDSSASDACEDSAAKFRIGQEVIVKTKYTKPYKAHIVGLWDMSQNGPYDEQGYLIKNLKGGVESMPEHALSLVTAKDSAELNNDADLRNADAAEACDATATVKSLNAIDDAMSAIKSAMDKVRSAYAVYCGEIGREKPNANVKDSNSRTFKALEEAKSAAVGWYRSLYSSQRVF